MPPNTVKVDRSTKWGNPFRVGIYGTAQQCVRAFQLLLGGFVSIASTTPNLCQQHLYRDRFLARWRDLAGKNLACWCRQGQPCHADVLIWAVEILAKKERQ